MTDRFVVTGSARSGTTWISRTLTGVGIPCGHEEVFNPGEVAWPDHLRADSSWVAACKVDQVDVPVALLVRHPLSVVKSLVEIGFFSWDTGNPYHQPLRDAFPQVYTWATPEDRALQTWVTLNRAALARAEMVLRFEEVTRDPMVFGRFLAWAGGNPYQAEDAITQPPCNRHQESRSRTGIAYVPVWHMHDHDLADHARQLSTALGYGED